MPRRPARRRSATFNRLQTEEPSTLISLRLPTALLADLQQTAARLNWSQATCVRAALALWLHPTTPTPHTKEN